MLKNILALTVFYVNFALAADATPSTPNPAKIINSPVAEIIDPPGAAALNIIVNNLSSLKALRKQNKASIENVEHLIKVKLLPNIATNIATELTLKKHWLKLSDQQKLIFKAYIVQSLIKDYAGILGSYEKLESVKITVDPKIKRKGNKAIVKLVINLGDNPKPIHVTLKMIRSNQWRAYDLVFSGVSLMKNYRAQFNSHIRRKGIDSLVSKISKKIK
ncbi:MAG TPA: ABC transporter substrate-binding protein [Gammaproteobacteria bacterium]|nr:ABC transporter substrate-binding protein [Gammaproteobacteria bacterium]